MHIHEVLSGQWALSISFILFLSFPSSGVVGLRAAGFMYSSYHHSSFLCCFFFFRQVHAPTVIRAAAAPGHFVQGTFIWADYRWIISHSMVASGQCFTFQTLPDNLIFGVPILHQPYDIRDELHLVIWRIDTATMCDWVYSPPLIYIGFTSVYHILCTVNCIRKNGDFKCPVHWWFVGEDKASYASQLMNK